MRIGLLHLPDKSWGGVYQYSQSVIETLSKNDLSNEYLVIDASTDTPGIPADGDSLSAPRSGSLPARLLGAVYNKLLNGLPFLPLLVPFSVTRLGRWKKQQNGQLDLLVSPVPSLHLEKLRVPYIMVIHDVMHRFKTEERQSGWPERLYRDVMYGRGARCSTRTVVFSEEAKKDLERFYGIPPQKVSVIPCLPPPHVYQYKDMTPKEIERALRRFGLPDRFIFYPANFWRHKNHANLIKALDLIKRKHQVAIPAVFVGQKKEAFDEVMGLAESLGVGDQIFYPGFVSEKELVALYKKAIAMVIPTMFEVGSLPIVEALVLETCCLCSNAPSLAEQGGDAALTFDPHDPADIAEKVWAVWTDEGLRQDLVARGKRLVAERYTQEINTQMWIQTINDAATCSS